MITKEQTEAFKKVLGKKYTAKVKVILNKGNAKNMNGKPHSIRMITNVINGEHANPVIEDAIIKAVEIQLKEFKKLERKKEKLLNSI